MRFILTLVLLGLMAVESPAAEVVATLSPQDASIGDRLLLDLHVQGAPSSSIHFPFPDAPDFALLSIDSSGLQSESRLRYTLAIYDTGRFVLPEMGIVISGVAPETLFTPQFGVSIHSVAPDTASAILPLKAYREHPFRWQDVWRAVKTSPWTWVVLALFLATAAWWVWRRYFRRKPLHEVVPAVVLPPHEQATRDLTTLRDKRYPSRGMMKEFFSEYTQIMRTYLERRYEFPALETTTFDLERNFEEDRFPEILARRLIPTFHEADLVKFAKYIPPLEVSDSVLETGFEIVSQTKPSEVFADEAKAA